MTVKRIVVRHQTVLSGENIAKLPKPAWIKTRIKHSSSFNETDTLLQNYKLNTVCAEAACPNIGECWSEGHATVMILGSICTRACKFCNVATGKPDPIDHDEPSKIADMVQKLKLRHVVITSVDRDDLKDGGASHFANVIKAIRNISSTVTIEVLTPDFLRKDGAMAVVSAAKPDVFNHNIETVPRLYPSIRPGARYFQSMRILHEAKILNPSIFTKSGLMLGLGETKEEIIQVMDDLRCAEVDFLTLGQYLQPSYKHAPVVEYVHPDEFKELEKLAKSKGFLMVSASPLTRSSYHADADFTVLKRKRYALH